MRECIIIAIKLPEGMREWMYALKSKNTCSAARKMMIFS